MKKLHALFRLLFSRAVLIGLLLFLQLSLFIVGIVYLSQDFIYLYLFFIMLSVAVCVWILNNRRYSPDIKLAWIIPIAFFPVFGGLLYLLFGAFHLRACEREYLQTLKHTNRTYLPASLFPLDGAFSADAPSADMSLLRKSAADKEASPRRFAAPALDDTVIRHSHYITQNSGYPPYFHTDTRYYPLGEVMWQDMLADLRKARRFIFLEYFIIEPGAMWDAILSILLDKAAAGVEVRILYDDMGCMYTLPPGYFQSLAEKGIRAKVFSPFRPRLEPAVNRRDHRKLCIIDGVCGYTGGINLADEYINLREKHGHWKDTAIRLAGDAVRSFTVMFLQLWDFCPPRRALSDYARYLDPPASSGPSAAAQPDSLAGVNGRLYQPDPLAQGPPPDSSFPAAAYQGLVQPYANNPLDGENIGESVYLGILNRALRYVYIMTPYLIPGHELLQALILCAKSGVDVRIITPHIADKWFVHEMTRSHYQPLIEAGVKIYEYTPGFLHSKVFLCDDQIGTVGSVNLDYRSLRLHFENGVYLAGAKCLVEIRADFKQTLARCTRITLADCQRVPLFTRLIRAFLRIIAPLM